MKPRYCYLIFLVAISTLMAVLPLAWTGGAACLAIAFGIIWRNQIVALIRR